MKLVCLIVVSCHLNVIHSRVDIQPSEADRINHIGLLKPGLRLDPRVRCLFLKIVLKLLFEKSQVIVQSDSVSCQSQRCDGIKETCRQTSKSAVSKRRLRLNLFNFADIFSVFLKHFFYFLVDSQVDHIVGKKFSDQELCRNIVKLLLAVCALFFCRHFLYRRKKRAIDLFIRCIRNCLSKIVFYFFLNTHGRSPFIIPTFVHMSLSALSQFTPDRRPMRTRRADALQSRTPC